MTARIGVPEAVRDGSLAVVASVSGGKDSTALILALREAEVPARYVFADTQWEAPETYAYLDTLRSLLGITIDVVGTEGGMLAKIRDRYGFPSRLQRWCTRELKIEPLRAYHDALNVETVSAMGIRAEESEARAKMRVFDLEEGGEYAWGGWLWRPLLAWSVSDVLAIHHRHGVPVHPLYLEGHDRVGCYPCIYARKEEIRLIAARRPDRVDEIRALEREIEAARAVANEEHAVEQFKANAARLARGETLTDKDVEPRFAHMAATFFQAKEPAGHVVVDGMKKRFFLPTYIDRVVEWSRSGKGGKQTLLLPEPPMGGCMRWGMCEPPSKGSEAAA